MDFEVVEQSGQDVVGTNGFGDVTERVDGSATDCLSASVCVCGGGVEMEGMGVMEEGGK